jgi:excisionase family DNA binding protein
MSISTWRGEFISAQEVCDFLRLDPGTVYELARIGEIPGVIWGETLRFEVKEFEKWYDRFLYGCVEEALRQLEEEGVLTSYVDSDGERRYVLTTRTLH